MDTTVGGQTTRREEDYGGKTDLKSYIIGVSSRPKSALLFLFKRLLKEVKGSSQRTERLIIVQREDEALAEGQSENGVKGTIQNRTFPHRPKPPELPKKYHLTIKK